MMRFSDENISSRLKFLWNLWKEKILAEKIFFNFSCNTVLRNGLSLDSRIVGFLKHIVNSLTEVATHMADKFSS